MKGTILHCFPNSDLRCGHDGLADQAKRAGHNPKKLQPGEYLIFINTGKDKIKLFAAGEVIAYRRMQSGQQLDQRAIAWIPEVFGSTGKLDLDKATAKMIEENLKRKRPSVLEAGKK